MHGQKSGPDIGSLASGHDQLWFGADLFLAKLFGNFILQWTRKRLYQINSNRPFAYYTFGHLLIETKNWSEKSSGNLDLRSPVQQVKRTNFALFKILTEDIVGGRVKLKQHHWGDRKIPIRNLIVFINSKPKEEFQYVKILTVNELLSYIKYFEPMFTGEETQAIASYLLNMNSQKKLTQREL